MGVRGKDSVVLGEAIPFISHQVCQCSVEGTFKASTKVCLTHQHIRK